MLRMCYSLRSHVIACARPLTYSYASTSLCFGSIIKVLNGYLFSQLFALEWSDNFDDMKWSLQGHPYFAPFWRQSLKLIAEAHRYVANSVLYEWGRFGCLPLFSPVFDAHMHPNAITNSLTPATIGNLWVVSKYQSPLLVRSPPFLPALILTDLFLDVLPSAVLGTSIRPDKSMPFEFLPQRRSA